VNLIQRPACVCSPILSTGLLILNDVYSEGILGLFSRAK
jgi:hypothetical protein